MNRYSSWPTTNQGSIVGSRLASEMNHRFTGALNVLSFADQKDAALAELLATTGEVFNVKSFGAKGDDSTDDTAAFVAVVAAAGVGGVILIPPAIYQVDFTGETGDLLSLLSGQTIWGYGATIKNTGGRTPGIFRLATVAHVSIFGLELDGNITISPRDSTSGGVVVFCSAATHCVFRDLYIHDSPFDGFTMSDGSANCLIDNCRITNSGRWGIACTNTTSHNTKIVNCNFTGNGYAHTLAGGSVDIEVANNCKISNCSFESSAVAPTSDLKLHGNDHLVENCTFVELAANVQAAVSVDTDCLRAKFVNCHIEISTDSIMAIGLEGSGHIFSNCTVVNNGDGSPANTYCVRGSATTDARLTSFSHCNFRSNHGAIVDQELATAEWIFSDCRFESIHTTDDGSAANVVIVHLEGAESGVLGGHCVQAGIDLEGTGLKVHNVTMDGVESTGNGIDIDATSVNCSVFGNRITRYSNGIEVSNGAVQIVMDGNVCYSNAADGIALGAGTVTNRILLGGANACFDNGAEGIDINGPGVLISNDILLNNNTSGEGSAEVAILAVDDGTPSIRDHTVFKTNNSSITITNFDNGFAGKRITIIFGDGNTVVDFTGTNLKGNVGANWSPVANDHMTCVFDGTNWLCDISDNTA